MSSFFAIFTEQRDFMKKFLFVLMSFPFIAFAGNDNHHIGGREAGMGNASVGLHSVWSAHHNQAGLAFVNDISAGLYFENRFLLKGLSIQGGAFALPTKSGTFGLAITHFGDKNYSEGKYGLSYGRKLGENVAMGLGLNYVSTRFGGTYGKAGTVTAELGFQTKLLDKLTLGAHVYNPLRVTIDQDRIERIPVILRIGGAYEFSEKVIASVEVEKDIDYKGIVKAGLEYKPTEKIYLRAGVASNPVYSSFGVGLNLSQFQVDFSTSYHYTLGFTPQIGLRYKFKK